MGLAIRDSIQKAADKPKLLRLLSLLLLLLLVTTPSNASKPVKLRVPRLEHGKKKSQVGKQWVGNGKAE